LSSVFVHNQYSDGSARQKTEVQAVQLVTTFKKKLLPFMGRQTNEFSDIDLGWKDNGRGRRPKYPLKERVGGRPHRRPFEPMNMLRTFDSPIRSEESGIKIR
jgi:hypothetical protein